MNKLILMVALVLVTAVVVTIWWRHWIKSRALNIASDVIKKVSPIWAVQGPFTSGEESAKAFRYAHLAVNDPLLQEGMLEANKQHAAAYDDDPVGWEENRELSLSFVTDETMEYVRAARALAEADELANRTSNSDEQ